MGTSTLNAVGPVGLLHFGNQVHVVHGPSAHALIMPWYYYNNKVTLWNGIETMSEILYRILNVVCRRSYERSKSLLFESYILHSWRCGRWTSRSVLNENTRQNMTLSRHGNTNNKPKYNLARELKLDIVPAQVTLFSRENGFCIHSFGVKKTGELN